MLSLPASRPHLARGRCGVCGNIQRWWWLWLGILLAGCRVGPEYSRPHTVAPDTWHQELEHGVQLGSQELACWWTMFDDPLLNELIGMADQGNFDLAAAYARISQARAGVCIARADKIPNLNGTGQFQNFKGFGGIPGFLAGARDLWSWQTNVSWEVDVFGRIHRQIEAADADCGAQVEAYRDILVALHGDIAQSYVQVRTLQQQLKYARQNVQIQQKALDLAERRVEAGVAANLDQFQAESNLASTEAEIPPLEAQLHQALNRLAVLTGQYPGAVHASLAQPLPLPAVPDALPMILPCELIRQRPDIRQAERNVAARTAEVGVAISDLYPRFTLGGNFGLQSQNFSSLFDGNSFTYGLGPSFSWAIFQAGRIRCNICRTEAAVDEAFAIYEQTLLRAVEEIENAIVGFNKERARREALQRTVTAAQESLESVLALYREGKSDFQNVLDTQRTLFQTQNGLAISEGQIITQLVTLYRALGGGWDPAHHCVQRLPCLTCPDRAPAGLVESLLTESSPDLTDANANGGRPDADSKDDDDTADDESDSQPRPDQRQGDERDPTEPLRLPDIDEDELPDPDDSFFDRMLKDLEERLQTSPAESADSPE